jgi:eukaryotic-like serine/threonine-protein kinase
METNSTPNYPNGRLEPDSPDRTLSTGDPGGPAVGQIGPYRLLQMIGEGGMGEVWLAEQRTTIRRSVALKLIKSGMDTKTVVARFESERQALALMDHPNIAQVYDAGSTPDGRPYFVMEYVPGLSITEYCDKHRLSMQERLELFQQVCEGVQHAHQKAIIHRDLKPSNILIVEQDNKPAPKIIDFGLAKAMAQRLTEKTMFTEVGALVGTPEYMSPEQADLCEQNIDTRTDVYSLGVILYELLVGALPFDAKSLRAAGLEAILRVIREVEPPKPSTKVRSLGDASAATAEKRREEPRSFARHLQGELDWITLKALEKDRTRRYGTASELSADIARYLRNEPVMAGPATAGYHIRKYAARHWFGLGAAACLALLVIGFVITQAAELHRIRLERDRANRERDRANRITDFMTRMFKVSDPSEARGNSITAREILDKASQQIDTGLTRDPETQAQLMDVMGNVYLSLGLYPRSQPLLERAVDIDRRVLGPRNLQTLSSMNDLFRLRLHEGHYTEAEKLGRETLDLLRQVLGPEHPETLNSMNNLGAVYEEEGKYAQAEALQSQTLEIQRRVLGPEHRDTLASMVNLAFAYQKEGKYAQAEALDSQALEIYRRVSGPEYPYTLSSMDNLASVYDDEGKYAQADALESQTLEIRRRVLGPEHPDTLQSMNDLAGVYEDESKYAQAEALDRRTLDIQRRVLGPEHPDTAISVYNLACLAALQGHKNKAFSLLREAVDHGLPPRTDLRIDKDPDLKSLHGDPRFAAFIAHAKEKAAQAQQKPRGDSGGVSAPVP